MKKKKIGLLPKVIVGIALGIVCGLFFPDWLVRGFLIINSVFGNFFNFIIPLLIVGLIAPGIANLGKDAGKLLVITVALAYGFTVFAGLFSYFSCGAVYPWLLKSTLMVTPATASGTGLTPYFTIDMPPVMSVMSALVLAFTLGFGISAVNSEKLGGVMNDFKDIINKVIMSVIIPLLPLYIFTIFLNITNSGQVNKVLEVFIKIIILIFIITLIFLLIQFSIAGIVSKSNPLKLLKNMLPAYATALGTQSSAATIPVTYEQALKNNVHPSLAGFVVPLCATIHMPGSTLKIVACSLAIIMTSGLDISFTQFLGFIMTLGIAMIAAPGVPGGAIMAAVGLLSSMLGFNDNLVGLMIALYIVMDSFGTATNVTGDGAIAVIINKIYDMDHHLKTKKPQ